MRIPKVAAAVTIVTPEIAKKWLENGMYKYQRPLKWKHVAHLSEEMIAGRFQQDTVVKFGILNEMEIMTDGQHRLTAMVENNISNQMVVVNTVMNNEEELARNYIEIDLSAFRTWADAFRALSGVRGIENNLSMSQTNALKGAAELIYRGFMKDGIRSSNTVMFNKCLEWLPYAHAYFDAIKGSPGNMIKVMGRRHLVAIGIATIRFAKNHSPIEFWQQVALNDGIRAIDIRRLLHDRLEQSRLQNSIGEQRNMTGKQMLWYTARAWNAWTKDEQLVLLKLPKDAPPILNTPFDYSIPATQYRKCFESDHWGDRWQ